MKFTILGKNVWGSAPALLYFVTHASIFYLSACSFPLAATRRRTRPAHGSLYLVCANERLTDTSEFPL